MQNMCEKCVIIEGKDINYNHTSNVETMFSFILAHVKIMNSWK